MLNTMLNSCASKCQTLVMVPDSFKWKNFQSYVVTLTFIRQCPYILYNMYQIIHKSNITTPCGLATDR